MVSVAAQAVEKIDIPEVPDNTASLRGDNDNDLMIQDISDADITAGGQRFIDLSQRGYPVDIRIIDIPHEALLTAAERLEKMGISYQIARPLLDALRADILKQGGSFARDHNAKPIEIIIAVQNTLPESRFEGAVTDVACINSQRSYTAGATKQDVRSTISGTATSTSNESAVENVFAHVNTPSFWRRLSAPTREQLDGMMSDLEAGMVAAMEALGGSVDIEALKEIIDELREQGTLNANIEKLIAGLITLQEAIGPDGAILNPAQLEAALADLSELMAMDGMDSLIPPSLLEAAGKVLADLSSNEAVMALLAEHGLDAFIRSEMSPEQALEQTLDELKEILAGEEPGSDLAKALSEIIADMEAKIEAGEISPTEIMADLKGQLEGLRDFPAISEVIASMETLLADIEVADNTIALKDIAAQIDELAAQVERGEIDIEDLPPELKALVETAIEMAEQGIENRVEALTEHLTETMGPDSGVDGAVLLSTVVAELAQPEIMALIPPEMVGTLTPDNIAAQIDELTVLVEAGEVDIRNLPPELKEIVEVAVEMKAQGVENRTQALSEHLAEVMDAGHSAESADLCNRADVEITEMDGDSIKTVDPETAAPDDVLPEISALAMGNQVPEGEAPSDGQPASENPTSPELAVPEVPASELPPAQPSPSESDPLPAGGPTNPADLPAENFVQPAAPAQEPVIGDAPPPADSPQEGLKDNPPTPREEPNQPPPNNPQEPGPAHRPDQPSPEQPGCRPGCDCGGQFNEAAKYEKEGNKVTLTHEDGTKETLTREEANKKIAAEVLNSDKMTKDEWQKILDKNEGDAVKAREYVIKEIKEERSITQDTVAKYENKNYDSKRADDAINRKREALKARQAARSGEPEFDSEKPKIKKIFEHICDGECDHGPKDPEKGKENKDRPEPYKATKTARANDNGEPRKRVGLQGKVKARSPAPKV